MDELDFVIPESRLAGCFFNPISGQPDMSRAETELWLTGVADPHVASTDLWWQKKTAWISTVHLRIDHDFGWGGPEGEGPVLWETMIFGADINTAAHGLEDFQTRYRSQEKAIWGHGEVVKALTTLLVSQGHTVTRHDRECPLLALQDEYRRTGVLPKIRPELPA